MGKLQSRIGLAGLMIIHFALFAGLSVAKAQSPAGAPPKIELIMFEQYACEWCEIWDEQIGVVYHKTTEGRSAPLRRVDIHDKRPDDLLSIDPVVYTPTFVLVENGVEVGRMRGYPGEDFFWDMLAALIRKAPSTAERGS